MVVVMVVKELALKMKMNAAANCEGIGEAN